MKKKVTELIVNSINPRKISKMQRARLMESILLFPKMLSLRKIIINKDGVILAGNQRVSVLIEISTRPAIEWMILVQETERWKSLSEKEKDMIVTFWKKWSEKPLVDVEQVELSEEEEKELVIKDNNEYGDFDYNKLSQIYDEISLINFGFDEGLFYNPDDDEYNVVKHPGSKPVKVNMLTFGKNTIDTTLEEYNILLEIYNDYIDDVGVSFGFVTSLLKKFNEDIVQKKQE